MNPTIGIALLLTVLQVARGQKVTSLTACLVNQSLRLDCHHENTTTTPMQYEFSLTRDTKKWVLSGSNGVTRPEYSSRTKFFSKYNLKVLYLSNFTTKDEGTYTCELRLSGPNPTVSNKDVSVFRGDRLDPGITLCLLCCKQRSALKERTCAFQPFSSSCWLECGVDGWSWSSHPGL
uniref:Thy-1 cell surface antigen n=1 Tax=Ovis aries TaxID=9940 RepID=A0AC11BV37_SHEEP